MSRTAAEALIDVFEEVGVEQLLGPIGRSLNRLGDAVWQSKTAWRGVRHEEDAALPTAGAGVQIQQAISMQTGSRSRSLGAATQ